MKLCNVIKLVRGTLPRDTPAGRGMKLCNVIKLVRGTLPRDTPAGRGIRLCVQCGKAFSRNMAERTPLSRNLMQRNVAGTRQRGHSARV